MNSFRVISNVKLIASNVHTKKTTSISAHGSCPMPIILRFFNRHVYFLSSENRYPKKAIIDGTIIMPKILPKIS